MSVVEPPPRIANAPGHLTAVRLGMPHLVPHGLSETWLLKHLGDLHWQQLALALGRPAAAIADAEGNRVYAAFRALTIADARLDRAREDAHLAIRTELGRFSRTQVASRHTLAVDGRDLGTVTLLSAFIRRDGDTNRRVLRVEVPGLAAIPAFAGGRLPAPEAPDAAGPVHLFPFTPCPGEDFNGAGFLYFSSYVAIAERAAFARDPAGASATTSARAVAFHGNIDPGDRLVVATDEAPAGGAGPLLRTEIRNAADGRPLATIATRKSPAAAR